MKDRIVAILLFICIATAGTVTLVTLWNHFKVDATPHVHVKAKVYFNNLKYYNSTLCLTKSTESVNIVVEDGRHIETKYMVVIR